MTRPQNETVRPMVFSTAIQSDSGTLRLMARRSVNVCRWPCRHAQRIVLHPPTRLCSAPHPGYLGESLGRSP